MADKNPFDVSNMMKGFDPLQLSRLFDPNAMAEMLQKFQAPGFDMQNLMDENSKHFEGLQKANQAATDAYQEMLARQMEILERVMGQAQTQVAELSEPEALRRGPEIYSQAFQSALELMQQMAEATQTANEKAYGAVSQHLTETIEKATKTK